MNQLCKVCGEPAAGFHFGAFTCEGCKSFFGRTYNNIAAIAGCKNNGDCVINKKNRTACKACRLRKCLLVGMSKSGSRYGRRSNWFKIHCLLQEQQTNLTGQRSDNSGAGAGAGSGDDGGGGGCGGGSNATGNNTTTNSRNSHNLEQLARLHSIHARQTYQDKTNPCIKSAVNMTAAAAAAAAAAALTMQSNVSPVSTTNLSNFLSPANKFLNGRLSKRDNNLSASSNEILKIHLSDTPSDSGASSAGDAIEESASNASVRQHSIFHLATTTSASATTTATITLTSTTTSKEEHQCSPVYESRTDYAGAGDFINDETETERKHHQLLEIFRNHSKPLHSRFVAFNFTLPPPQLSTDILPAVSYSTLLTQKTDHHNQQDEPIDLSLKATCIPERGEQTLLVTKQNLGVTDILQSINKPAPLDLTLVRTSSALSG